MSGIFVSYRRQDSQGSAGRLADALKARFTGNQIFRDVETIEAGVDFVDAIERALASCVVLLAVIGPRWLNVTDKNNKRRLDDPNDYTRIEISVALKRNVRVVPVLVDGAVMPEADELPDELKSLARRQASELSDKRWDFDVQQLLATLEKIPGINPAPRPSPSPVPPAPGPAPAAPKKRKWVWIAAIAVFVLGLIGYLSDRNDRQQAQRAFNPPAMAQIDSSAVSKRAAMNAAPADDAVEPSPSVANLKANNSDVGAPKQNRAAGPNLNGAWSDSFGNRYLVQQQGSFVSVEMMQNSLGRSAQGRGTINGRFIAMDYGFVEPSIGVSVGRANVEVSPDGTTIHGSYVETASGVQLPFLLKK